MKSYRNPLEIPRESLRTPKEIPEKFFENKIMNLSKVLVAIHFQLIFLFTQIEI